jgi:hypothetical protein
VRATQFLDKVRCRSRGMVVNNCGGMSSNFAKRVAKFGKEVCQLGLIQYTSGAGRSDRKAGGGLVQLDIQAILEKNRNLA